METNSSLDYFISYTEADRECAVWIAWQLEEIGHTVKIDVWDFKPGQNFPIEMHHALSDARKVIAILSENYLAAELTGPEWAGAFSSGKLLPVIIQSVAASKLGLFGSMIGIDLTGLSSKAEIKQRLLEKIRASEDGARNKPVTEPPFPETLLTSAETCRLQNQAAQADNSENTVVIKINKEDSPEFKAGLVDKDAQARHIFKWVDGKFFTDEQEFSSPLSFLLFGADSQWPEALSYILYSEIKYKLGLALPSGQKPQSPEPIRLTDKIYHSAVNPEDYLWELISKTLTCPASSAAIGEVLGNEPVPRILFRPLFSHESSDPALVRGMLEAWSKLKFTRRSPRHILILFYDCSDEPKFVWQRWFNKNRSLIAKIGKSLAKEERDKFLLPEIESPDKRQIGEWIDRYFDHSKIQEVKDFVKKEIRSEYERRKNSRNKSKESLYRIRMTADNYEIHHHDLKNILIDALKKFG